MLEEVLLGLWPQLVALVMIAWLISRLSEKMAQAEKKIEVLFQLFNKMKDDQQKMIAALIPQLLPILSTVVDKTIPDKAQKSIAMLELEKALVDNADKINLETIKTNQIEAGHKSIWVAGWRPASAGHAVLVSHGSLSVIQLLHG